MVTPVGGCAWLLQGGHAWLLWGGMHGCSGGACVVALGGCMVAPGGHVWLLWGGVWLLRGVGACVVALGGVHGCFGGACMVAPGGMRGCSGGHVWLLPGGGHAWDMTTHGDTVNERAVRILLECILVAK